MPHEDAHHGLDQRHHNAMNSKLRVPAHSRAHRSWPMALVPSQCAALGYLFFSGRPLASLLYCPGSQG